MFFGLGHPGRQMLRGSAAGGGVPPGASLDLNFMQPGVLDPRISFTRAAGPATYFDSSGVMRTAAVNLWLWSGDASNAAWVPAGVVIAAPTVTGNQTVAPDGTTTAASVVYPAVATANNASEVYQSITVGTAAYTMSVWLRGNVGGEQVYLLTTHDTSLYYRTRVTLTTAWQRFTLTTGALTAGAWLFSIGCDLRDVAQTSTPAQTIYVWGGQVEVGSPASPYIPTTTAPSGAPRWDYDPVTLALRGLLIEEARTNLQFPSVNFFTASAPSGSTEGIVHSVGQGLAGSNDAMALIPGAFSGVHQFYALYTGAVSTTYIFSVYVKAAGMNFVELALENSGFTGTNRSATFNLSTGTVDSQTTGASAQIQACGNGWYRCSMVATSAASSGAYVNNIYPNSVGGGVGVTTGNGVDGIWVWGQQVEVGAFATSYIPTTAAAVTRANDNCSMPVGAWFDQTKGSMSIEYIIEGVVPGFNGPAQLVGANVNTDYIDVDESTTTGSTPTLPTLAGSAMVIAGNGITFTSYNNAPNPSGVMHRGASAWALNQDMHSAHDGTLALVGAAAGSPGPATSLPVITNLQIAGTMHYQNQFNLWARRVRYWPRMLSDAELQSVTM